MELICSSGLVKVIKQNPGKMRQDNQNRNLQGEKGDWQNQRVESLSRLDEMSIYTI